MDCLFATIRPNLHRCPVCGTVVRSSDPPERIHARCTGSLAQKLAAQIARRIFNGEHEMPIAEIDRRHAVCQACAQFLGDNCLLLSFEPACPRQTNLTFVDALTGLDGDAIGCGAGVW